MIQIDRTLQDRPDDLDRRSRPRGQSGEKKTEAAWALVHFLSDPRPAEAFSFTAYSQDGVSKALNTLFKYKCAYCESRYGGLSPVDIEHFRPKGRILVSTEPRAFREGYWWLASEWINLLASCPDCNRARWHEFKDGKDELLGKADRFPIADEAGRAAGPGEEAAERPLLLNPCECDPADYLSFDYEEGKSIVSPASADQQSYPYACARTSIDTFGLNRPQLVEDRTERLDRARGWLKRIRRSRAALSNAVGDDREDLIESIADDMDELRAFTTRTAPWSAAIRAYVVRELQALGIEVGDKLD